MRGRKPTPDYLKAVKGEDLIDRPMPAGVPSCPEHLSQAAKDEWARLAPAMAELKLLTTVDSKAFEIYCALVARFDEAEQAVTEHGTVYKTDTGLLKVNPAVRLMQTLARELRAMCSEFGFTPSSRCRMKSPKTDRNELKAFLAGDAEEDDGQTEDDGPDAA